MKQLPFKGRCDNEVISQPILEDQILSYFVLTNMSAGVAIINVLIRHENGDTQVTPLNQELAVSEGFESVEGLEGMVVLDREQIVIRSSAPVDYYFSFIKKVP